MIGHSTQGTLDARGVKIVAAAAWPDEEQIEWAVLFCKSASADGGAFTARVEPALGIAIAAALEAHRGVLPRKLRRQVEKRLEDGTVYARLGWPTEETWAEWCPSREGVPS